MLFEEFCKCRDRDIESVCAIMLLDTGQLGLLVDTLGGLELANGRLRLTIDGIGEGLKGLGIRIIEETAFLEQE